MDNINIYNEMLDIKGAKIFLNWFQDEDINVG